MRKVLEDVAKASLGESDYAPGKEDDGEGDANFVVLWRMSVAVTMADP